MIGQRYGKRFDKTKLSRNFFKNIFHYVSNVLIINKKAADLYDGRQFTLKIKTKIFYLSAKIRKTKQPDKTLPAGPIC